MQGSAINSSKWPWVKRQRGGGEELTRCSVILLCYAVTFGDETESFVCLTGSAPITQAARDSCDEPNCTPASPTQEVPPLLTLTHTQLAGVKLINKLIRVIINILEKTRSCRNSSEG